MRRWDDKKAQIEIIAGRLMPEDRNDRYCGMVATHESKPKRRLYEVLRRRDVQPIQAITFLTDGADGLRALTSRLSPCAEHVVDCFHLTMPFTVLGQFVTGLANQDEDAGMDAEFRLTSAKSRLWNGDAAEALVRPNDLAGELRYRDVDYDGPRKVVRVTDELSPDSRHDAERYLETGLCRVVCRNGCQRRRHVIQSGRVTAFPTDVLLSFLTAHAVT